jgi:hypothetical protein
MQNLLQHNDFLVIIVLIIAFYAYWHYTFRKLRNIDSIRNHFPLALYLNEKPTPDWSNDKQAVYLITQLRQLGFRQGKSYTFVKIDGYEVLSFFNYPVTAMLYRNPINRLWVDMVIEELSGLEVTVSNASLGASVNTRPESMRFYFKDKSVSQLNDFIKSKIRETDYIEINEKNFKERFETIFKKDVSWKNRDGGISIDEFIGSDKGLIRINTSRLNQHKAFIDAKVQELLQWEEAALEEYRRATNVSIEQFAAHKCQFFIVPFKTDVSAFVCYLCHRGIVTKLNQDKLAAACTDNNKILTIFDALNTDLSTDQRFILVTEVDFPRPLKIYKNPN